MAATVRFDAEREDWYFGDEWRRTDGADSLVIKRIDLPATTATDLAKALRRARELDVAPDEVIVDTAPDDEYSPKESVGGPIAFRLDHDGALLVELTFSSDTYVEQREELETALRPLIEPYLHRNHAIARRIEPDAHRSMAPYFHTVSLAVPTRGRSLLDLWTIADRLGDLIDATGTGALTRETVVDLVVGQRADLLIGLPESSWLDVKSQHYDLSTSGGKISIAQAVSRFCNAHEGGVVVVGMSTKRRPGGEVVKAIQEVPIDGRTARRYRQALEEKLFPFPVHLRIDTVELQPGYGLVVISVPPQPEELKPFLVHGAIVDGRTEGAYISIVRRSGEDSIPITAQQIHSTLAAGRALLRRGHLPDDGG